MTASWKTWLWRTAITAAILILIGASFYAFENARGLRAWENCERDLAARGENLKWNDYIPAAVPDAENFFKAPMMTGWFAKNTNSSSIPFNQSLNNPENNTNNITDLSASNYIAWSEAFANEFDQIRAATKRPFARLDGNYSRPFEQPTPNFVSYRIVSQSLAHRARCHLVLDDPAAAVADLTLLHQLNLTLVKSGQSPLFITAMIHTAISGLYADVVACGIHSQIWREPELATLQKQLAEINLLPTVANSLRNERAGLCQALDVVSVADLSRMVVVSGSSPSKPVTDLGWRMLPRGWIYQNKTLIATLEQETIDAYNLTNQTMAPSKIKAVHQTIERSFEHTTPWNFLAAICLPNFSRASLSVARNQTSADQTQITCALERYRLAHGEYPAVLNDLIPNYLTQIPNDIITGKPMNYRRVDPQNFKLWSIGWNEVDESGTTIRGSDGKEDREAGDWVWQYPLL